jgi:small GTP-binding protein
MKPDPYEHVTCPPGFTFVDEGGRRKILAETEFSRDFVVLDPGGKGFALKVFDPRMHKFNPEHELFTKLRENHPSAAQELDVGGTCKALLMPLEAEAPGRPEGATVGHLFVGGPRILRALTEMGHFPKNLRDFLSHEFRFGHDFLAHCSKMDDVDQETQLKSFNPPVFERDVLCPIQESIIEDALKAKGKPPTLYELDQFTEDTRFAAYDEKSPLRMLRISEIVLPPTEVPRGSIEVIMCPPLFSTPKAMQEPAKTKPVVLKVISGGNGCGNTTLLQRFVSDRFLPNTMASLSVQFLLKKVTFGGVETALQLWDFGSMERVRPFLPKCTVAAKGAILLVDLTRAESTVDLESFWLPLLRRSGPDCPVLLVGTKLDMLDTRPRAIDPSFGHDLVKKHGLVGYIETSAKTSQNVAEAFHMLVKAMFEYHKIPHDPNRDSTISCGGGNPNHP